MNAFNKYVTVIAEIYILLIIIEIIISLYENNIPNLKYIKLSMTPNKRKGFSKTNTYYR